MNDIKKRLDVFLEGFIHSWKIYTEFYLDKVKDEVEDCEACSVVLKELKSGFPREFLHAYVFEKITEKMLRRAEDFDTKLFRVKLIALGLEKEHKENELSEFKKIESFLAFCVKCLAIKEGKWDNEN